MRVSVLILIAILVIVGTVGLLAGVANAVAALFQSKQRNRLRRESHTEALYRLVQQLDGMRYFRHVDPLTKASVLRQVVESGNLYDVGRMYSFLQDNNLEDDIIGLLADLSPFLAREGVVLALRRRRVELKERNPQTGEITTVERAVGELENLPPVEARGTITPALPVTLESDVEGTHLMLGDGLSCLLWKANTDRRDQQALRALLTTVNQLLSLAGSQELAWVVGVDTESPVVLVAERAHVALLVSSPLVGEGQRPLAPQEIRG